MRRDSADGPAPKPLAELATATDVAHQVAWLYRDPLEDDAGVVHVTSVWMDDDRSLVTLRIDEHAPKSELDFFALNLCRARADAIVVTGKILRDEPTVSHDLQGPGTLPQALADWRRRRLGKEKPPISLVLSSGRDLDLDHPLFHGATRPVIYTGPEGGERLAEGARARGIGLAAHPEVNLDRAIELLLHMGARTISIECGPRTSAALYRSPLGVDELMLSVYEGQLAEHSRGTVLMSADQLLETMIPTQPPVRCRTQDGTWAFERLLSPGRWTAAP